jgi:hypothetical protein
MRYPKPKILLGGWLRLFNQRTITSHQTGAVLLRRFHVVQWGGPDGPGVMLHQFFGPDEGRCLHDHPWDFVSVILRGAYDEQLTEATPDQSSIGIHCWRSRWSKRRLSATDRHRITWVAPGTWSLVLHGRKERTWGFHTPAGWVPFDRYDDAIGRRRDTYTELNGKIVLLADLYDVPIVLREDPVAPIAVEVEPGRLHALDLWADRRWDVT